GTVQFSFNGFNIGVPQQVNPVTGVASLRINNIPVGEGSYPIGAVFSPQNTFFKGSSNSRPATLTVTREDADVTLVTLDTLFAAGPITFVASIKEKSDDTTEGDISLAVPVTCTLNPLSLLFGRSGTTYTVTAKTSGGGFGG